MRATFYARVSTDRDSQNLSISNQIDFFQEYIKNNKITPAHGCGQLSRKDGTDEARNGYYVDEGLTASKSDVKNRRAFNQMVQDAKKGKFDIIYVKSVSRFSRSTETTLKIIKDLKEIGVSVYFDDIKMDSLDSRNDMFITMFASVAQEESRQRSEHIHFGIKRGMNNKKWTSSPPFGYDKVNGYLKINEEEAQTVKLIYDWYLNEGIGIKVIARRLKEMKVPTKMQRKNAKPHNWHHTTIKNIVNNPIYTGRMIQNRTRRIDINRGIVKHNPKEEYIEHHLEKLRIIDDDIYKCVQKEKDERMKAINTYDHLTRTRDYEDDGLYTQKARVQVSGKNRHSAAHLFSNLFYCGNCCGVMRRRKNYHLRTRDKSISLDSLEYHYVCATYDLQGKKYCEHRNLTYEDKLLEFVREEIRQRQAQDHSDKLEEMIEVKYDLSANALLIDQLQAEIDELNKDKSGLIRMQAREIISEEDYQREVSDIEAQLKTKKEELDIKSNINIEIDKLRESYTQFVQALKSLDLDNLTNPQLRKIITRINVYKLDEYLYSDLKENPVYMVYWRFMDTTDDDLVEQHVDYWLKKRYDSLTDEEKAEENRKTEEFAEKFAEFFSYQD